MEDVRPPVPGFVNVGRLDRGAFAQGVVLRERLPHVADDLPSIPVESLASTLAVSSARTSPSSPLAGKGSSKGATLEGCAPRCRSRLQLLRCSRPRWPSSRCATVSAGRRVDRVVQSGRPREQVVDLADADVVGPMPISSGFSRF